MSVKLYYDLMSQPSRALYMFFKLAKIPFESCPVALRKGEHLTEEFEKINPAKRVPVLEHNGFILTESVAILRYSARQFQVGDNWYPKDSQRQAKVDEFLEWQHLNLRSMGSMFFRHRVILPLLSQTQPDQKKLEFYKSGLADTLKLMEKMFLSKTPFLNSQEISVADLLGACEVEQPISAGLDVLKDRPVLNAWMERVRQATQPYYDEAHKFSKKLGEQIANAKL